MNRLKDYDAMKGLTTILVVFAHVTRMFSPQGAVPLQHSPVLEFITNFIYVFHMPAFVAVTGAVYYFVKREKGKYKDAKLFTLDKAKRLLIPFVFFSFVVVFPSLHYIGLREDFIRFAVREVASGISGVHLWYSVMIFIVFILFNFFEEKIYNNKDWVNWVLFILLNLFDFMVLNVFQFRNVMRYAIYFYLGYRYQKNRSNYQLDSSGKLLSFFGVTAIAYAALFYMPAVSQSDILTAVFQLVGALSGTVMLYIASNKISQTKLMDDILFTEIINSSYGIYLFHPMIIYLLSYWEQGTRFHPFVLAVANFAVALLLSIFLSHVLRKMNWQIFIGERTRPWKKVAGKSV